MGYAGGKEGVFRIPRFGKPYLGFVKGGVATIVDEPLEGVTTKKEETYIIDVPSWRSSVGNAKILKNARNTAQNTLQYVSTSMEDFNDYWNELLKRKGWLLTPPKYFLGERFRYMVSVNREVLLLVRSPDGVLLGGMLLLYTPFYAEEAGLFSEHIPGLYVADLLKLMAVEFCEWKGIPYYDLSGKGTTPGIDSFKRKWSSRVVEKEVLS